jgi:hypothetical protein
VGSPSAPPRSRDDQVLVRADGVGVAGDPGQPVRGDQVRVAARVARDDQVGRGAGGVQQLHQRYPQHLAQLPQVADLEGLHEHRRTGLVEPGPVQRVDQGRFQRQPDPGEVAGVLGLRVDAELPAQLGGQPVAQRDDLVERRHLEAPVIDRVPLPQQRHPLGRAQRLQLGQGEVLGEPAGQAVSVDLLAGVPVGELGMLGDVGGAADLRLVPGHEHPVRRRHQVGFEEVGAHPGGQLVAGQGVLGPQPAGAAMGDEQHRRSARARGMPPHGGDHRRPAVAVRGAPGVVFGSVG